VKEWKETVLENKFKAICNISSFYSFFLFGRLGGLLIT
jgi:hypothetical protein